ncbi:putative disease resistance protein RGA1 [Papaver somniferum]|uniref:putative disease resistance protein RGA1 n=1 Tax=Papaver somniferum TaxID=3469 RepID=UPI000E70540C|nr:putative disease resistance protein RGA1 [Papaver somniferum]
MPRGIETLTCLEVLDSYLVKNRRETISCSSGADSDGMIELANLNSLRELWIFNLEFVRGRIDAERGKLKDKINLRYLCLRWGSIFDNDDDVQMVLEVLEPNVNLTKLEVQYFPGLKFPKWMGSSTCLPNLVEIILCGCIGCEKLPALGLLPCLRVLETWKMRSVKCLGDEFYYQQEEEEERIRSYNNPENATTTISLFPSLIRLKLLMENLEEWVAPQLPIYSSFPSLEKLEISCFRKLRSTPNLFHCLKELQLCDTNSKAVTSFFATGGRLTSLISVDISHSPELIYIPVGVLLQSVTPNLQQLSIKYCSSFQGFLEEDDLKNYYDNKDGDHEDDFESTQSFSCPKINSKFNNISNSLLSLNLRKCYMTS